MHAHGRPWSTRLAGMLVQQARLQQVQAGEELGGLQKGGQTLTAAAAGTQLVGPGRATPIGQAVEATGKP
jgi:hypothetical protein